MLITSFTKMQTSCQKNWYEKCCLFRGCYFHAQKCLRKVFPSPQPTLASYTTDCRIDQTDTKFSHVVSMKMKKQLSKFLSCLQIVSTLRNDLNMGILQYLIANVNKRGANGDSNCYPCLPPCLTLKTNKPLSMNFLCS